MESTARFDQQDGNDTGGRLRSMARRARAVVADETRSMMDERGINQKAAEHVRAYGKAFEAVGERVKANGGARIGSYVDDLTERTRYVSECLGDGDYRGALRETRRFAADHPELFLGLVFAASAYAGRVLREAMHEARREQQGSELPSGGATGGAGKGRTQGGAQRPGSGATGSTIQGQASMRPQAPTMGGDDDKTQTGSTLPRW